MITHNKSELSYDKGFPKSDRIFRIIQYAQEVNTETKWAKVSTTFGLRLAEENPEIEMVTRLSNTPEIVLTYLPGEGENKKLKVTDGFSADSTIFDIFDLEFIYGNPKMAFSDKNSIVLTESIAKKFFVGNPIGKVMTIGEWNQSLKVTGVIRDLPYNTHLKLNFLLPNELFFDFMKSKGVGWLLDYPNWAGMYNYVLLFDENDKADVENRIPEFLKRYFSGMNNAEQFIASKKYILQPIQDIHLHSKLMEEIGINSDITYFYIFSFVAVLILIIAGINYVNIATAQAFSRMKEVGIKTVIGSYRKQLVRQFIGESLLVTIISGVLSILIIDILLPYYDSFTGREFTTANVFSSGNILLVSAVIIGLGIISGIYPAFFVTRFKVIDIIRGVRDPASSANKLRKALVAFQFSISIFLIFCTFIIYHQMKYFDKKDLGFQKENVIVVELLDQLRIAMINDPNPVKAALKKNPRIINISMISNLPDEHYSVEVVIPEGNDDNRKLPQENFFRADEEFLQTLDIRLVEGQNFYSLPDNEVGFLLNESAVKVIDLKNLIGQRASDIFGNHGKITGVVGDYHYGSLHNKIEPLVIEYFHDPGQRDLVMKYLLIKYSGDNVSGILDYIDTTLKEFLPENLFVYSFLEDVWNNLYVNEINAMKLFRAFSIFAILISCLGLFGLSAYMAEVRIKAIGVRKVFGAGVPDLVKTLYGEYVRMVLLASVIALPLGWLAMELWLQKFAYHTKISLIFVILTILIALVISAMTVSYHIIRLIYTKPVDYLKYE
jgi:putative ABC transport system permease protein